MGANNSVSLNSEGQKLKLDDIPESCVALVLFQLDPSEICKLARLNRAFRDASSADFIWDSKLPCNCKYIMEILSDKKFANFTRKEIYATLYRSVSFDGGKKKIWLEKSTGGVCLGIASKAMKITGIDDKRYWNHFPTDESRFQTIAYLQQIWWLEVEGKFEFQFPPGTYSLFFRLQLGIVTRTRGRRVCNTKDIHGWDIKPVQFQLRMGNGQHTVCRCFLDNPGNWEYYRVGDFVVEEPNTLTKVKFSLMQIDCTHTKGGLCVDSVLVCPTIPGKDFRTLL